MSYTIKNLQELEDKAPQFGFEAVQEARFAHGDLNAELLALGPRHDKDGEIIKDGSFQ